ncbi:type I restriction endonuclease subunit M, partial [bacterium]|nr:type I restriction endonuclease subunit M [bacterium]
AEAEIRKNLVTRGYIKGIIGLPANLFYGTGIPACIVLVDKEGAKDRKEIFMIDASSGFMKDGNKNRLRSRDIHKIVDVFNTQEEVEKYSRLVPLKEIEKNEFNLNLPRYIDSQEEEDLQDIEAHLKGGIPSRDVEALKEYWDVCPGLKAALFSENRSKYLDLSVDKTAIKNSIFEHPEFQSYTEKMNALFSEWRNRAEKKLKALEAGHNPKEVIFELSEDLLDHYEEAPLLDQYDIYQHLMNYWSDTMQDDCYLIAADGWTAKAERIIEKDKKGKEKDKGWSCDLVPKSLIVSRYLEDEQKAITELETALEIAAAERTELEEEHGGEEGAFSELEKINKGAASARIKELRADKQSEAESKEEIAILKKWTELNNQESKLKKELKEKEAELDEKAYKQYPKLSELEIKTLVVDDKWLSTLESLIHGEMDRVSQSLTQRVKELAERYETPLPKMTEQVAELEGKVNKHLERMGFSWM